MCTWLVSNRRPFDARPALVNWDVNLPKDFNEAIVGRFSIPEACGSFTRPPNSVVTVYSIIPSIFFIPRIDLPSLAQ